KLVVREDEAASVRFIFDRFVKLGSIILLMRELTAAGIRSRRGHRLDKGSLYKLLNNRVYIGDAVHKGVAYPGEHQAIIGPDLWSRVHAIMGESPRTRANKTRLSGPSLLRGLIFSPNGDAMSPSHTRKGDRLYRYYVTQSVLKRGPETCPVRRLPAAEIEAAVVEQLRGLLRAPELIVRTLMAARQHDDRITEAEVREAFERLDPTWDELFPAEQARLVQLLVERVDVKTDGITIRLRTGGLTALLAELRSPIDRREAA
ncbi:recombinase family protein, partial [Pseudoxanthobacter sp. M-2]|uniref:recombinase family protein n=1 Tax=Pseudoxanthobacter sp. M-2 TaxID=3078754 RepID=UPI0038FBF857